MKKLTLIFIFLVLVSLPRFTASVHAATPTPTTADVNGVPMMEPLESTPGGIKKSEYTLPYPGILQNHPLYFLKELRDKVIEALIVDPTRKSEFYLLQSDKWIAASVILVDKGMIEIAQKTLDASTERIKKSVSELTTAKAQGRQIPSGTADKMESAIEKHLEIVDELSVQKKVNTDNARQTLVDLQDQVMKMRE